MPAGPNNLDLALRIHADVVTATAQVKTFQAEIAKTGATAKAASSGTTALAESATAAATASATAAKEVNAWGETAEQAAARVDVAVKAGLAQAAAQREATLAAIAASRSQTAVITAQESQAATLTALQNAQFAQTSRRVAAESQLAGVLAAKSLTEKQAFDAESLSNRLRAAGLITLAEQRNFIEQLAAIKIVETKVIQANTKANLENAASRGVLNSQAQSEIATSISEVAAGNFGRLRRSGAAFANQAGLLQKLMTPVGLGITAVAVSVGALAAAYAKGEAEQSAYNQALVMTGNHAGQSVAQLNAMAASMDAMTGVTQHAAAAVVAQVVATGQFTGNAVGEVSRAALAMQAATGQAADATIASFQKLAGDPVAVIAKMNESEHFLTAATFEHIRALQEEGNTAEAATVAVKARSDAMVARAKDVTDGLGTLQRAWGSVASVAKEAWDAMLSVGRQPSGKLGQLAAQIDTLRNQIARGNQVVDIRTGAVATFSTSQLDAMRTQLNQLVGDYATELATQTTKRALQDTNDARVNALQHQAQFAAPIDKLNSAEQIAAKNFTDATRGVQVGTKDYVTAQQRFQIELSAAVKQYDSATKTAKTTTSGKLTPPTVSAVDDGSATMARETAQAQTQLTQALIQQKAATDPAAAAWMAYGIAEGNARLKAQALTAQYPAQAAAIRAAETATIDLAKVTRDAKLDQVADEARKAWDDLRQQFGDPLDVQTQQALAKLQELQQVVDALKGKLGAPTSQQIGQTIQGIIDGSVPPPPRLRSIRGQNRQQTQLGQALEDKDTANAYYGTAQQSLQSTTASALTQFQGDKEAQLQIAQAYDAKYTQLAQTHAKTMQQIKHAEMTGTLSIASGMFGQLATLSSSHNKKMAAIGKTAAIAQAIINTYLSATEAYASLASIPYVGPALGAVAAGVAIVAGLANVAAIRSQPIGGYAIGGYTGAGGKFEPAGIVHRGEGVLSQGDIAALGGPAAFVSLRRSLHGYADGGFVAGPSLDQLAPRITAPRAPALTLADGNAGSARAAAPQDVKVVVVMDREAMASEIMNSRTGQKVIVQTAGDNPTAIRGKWGR